MSTGRNQNSGNSDPNSEEQFETQEQKVNEPKVESDDKGVLDDILAETKATASGEECLELIVGFCRANEERVELDMEVMLGIVKLILAKRFPKTELPQGCAEWISEVLFYDPASRQKIEELWKQAHLRIS